jgi:hypothetical protein
VAFFSVSSISQSPVKATFITASLFTLLAPRAKAFMPLFTSLLFIAATYPKLPVLLIIAANMPERYLA